MARMFPNNGPVAGTKSNAERLVYNSLKKLDDSYTVFHSVRWNNPDEGLFHQDGEVDFVIVHPEKGIILIEVKGGSRIRREQTTGNWYSTSRGGIERPIKNPFEQAKNSAHQMIKFLKNHPLSKQFNTEYVIFYGFWFPEILWNRQYMLETDDNYILSQPDLSFPEIAIDKAIAAAKYNRTVHISKNAVQALVDIFSPEIVIQSGLIETIKQDRKDIIQFTIEQATRFWAMRRYHHLTIPGGAGTGKTVLAYEVAWRLAKNGKRVLLLNYTEFQAKWLRHNLGSVDI